MSAAVSPEKLRQQAINLRFIVREIREHGGVGAPGNATDLMLLWERARVLSNMVLGDEWIEGDP